MNEKPKPLIYLSADHLPELSAVDRGNLRRRRELLKLSLQAFYEVKLVVFERVGESLRWTPPEPFNGLAIVRWFPGVLPTHFELTRAEFLQSPDEDAVKLHRPISICVAQVSGISIGHITAHCPQDWVSNACVGPFQVSDCMLEVFGTRLAAWGLKKPPKPLPPLESQAAKVTAAVA